MHEATIDVNALTAKQSVTGQEIVSYYKQDKNDLMTLEQFHVSYIKLDAATMQQLVSDADIQSYYGQHQDQFTQPQRTHYSIIQAKAKGETKAVLDELDENGDLVASAKEKSADIISAHSGGGIGWLGDATIPDELKNTGLKEKSQLSGVIKSSAGFLIVCLDDTQSVKVKSLDEVHDDIAAKVKHKKALDVYYALQQKTSDMASNDTEFLAGTEQAAGVKATQTGRFSKDNLPEELSFKSVTNVIFSGGLTGGNDAPDINSDIIAIDDGCAFMLRINEHKPEAMKSLADVREQVEVLVQYDRAEQQVKVGAEKLLVDSKVGKNAGAMQAAGLKFDESKTLGRSGRDPISQAAFALPLPARDKPSYGMTTDMQGNVALLAPDKVKQGSMSEDQKKATVQGITQSNTQIVLEALMNNLCKEVKIEIGDALEQQ